MIKNVLVTVDDGGKIRDYRMTVEDADRVHEVLTDEGMEVNIIHVEGVDFATADEVLNHWSDAGF